MRACVCVCVCDGCVCVCVCMIVCVCVQVHVCGEGGRVASHIKIREEYWQVRRDNYMWVGQSSCHGN